nr:hypothetical protein [Tanacetum cinerariifolium]
IVYGYDGLPIQPVAPPSPDYVPGPEHPHLQTTCPALSTHLRPLRYLAPSDDEAPLEDQPLPVNASPTAASPGYMTDSDPEEDPEEDGDDEPSDGNEEDTDDEDPEEEPFEENDEEEEEHPALADSLMVPNVDLALSAREAEALEPDEPIHAPGSPISIPLSQTHLRAPLGYRAAGIRMRALLSSTSPRTDIPEADMPLRKKAYLTTPGFEIGESSVAGATRQPGPTESD